MLADRPTEPDLPDLAAHPADPPRFVIGVDIGGTKILAGAIDSRLLDRLAASALTAAVAPRAEPTSRAASALTAAVAPRAEPASRAEPAPHAEPEPAPHAEPAPRAAPAPG